MRRSYNQYCPVARTLDLVGDRWTLLMIRDLFLGPRRYKDLLEGLPGIGTNLLADRLRELEEAGVVERAVLPPPAGSSVYQLTEIGEKLWPVVVAMGRWGSRFLGPVRDNDVLLPAAYLIAMRAAFRPERAVGVDETFELRVGDRAYEVTVKDGRCSTREGLAVDPGAVFVMDVETLNDLLFGQLAATDAVSAGRVEIRRTDAAGLDRFLAMFSLGRRS